LEHFGVTFLSSIGWATNWNLIVRLLRYAFVPLEQMDICFRHYLMFNFRDPYDLSF